MTPPRTRLAPPPRGLGRLEAAAHVGVSPATFERMVAAGLMPPPRRIFSLKVWDLGELDAFFDALPHHGAEPSPAPPRPANLPAEDFV